MDREDRFEFEIVSIDDESLPPQPPDRPRESGRGGQATPAIMRSPWWMIPLLVSLVIGIERLLMLTFIPGFRELGVTLFGSLFVLTFAAVLTAGGLYIRAWRR